VFEGESAPDGEVERPTVQVELAFATVEPGAKVAFVGAEADAAAAEKIAMRLPSAVAPTMAPTSRRGWRVLGILE